jgi:RNA polymerase sigma-70 factor (ECF subfamily)
VQTTFDAAWRARALAGDAQAVAQLAHAAPGPLYRFCYYRVGQNRHLCEEVVQETLVQAIRRLENYEPARSRDEIFPWLTGLARNEIHRALAREKPNTSLEAMWSRMDDQLREVYARIETSPFGTDVLERQETREMVGATMSQLPAHYRDALEAKYLTGMSVRDMAHAWSMTEKAVESQLTRARRAFRETFLTLAGNLDDAASPY